MLCDSRLARPVPRSSLPIIGPLRFRNHHRYRYGYRFNFNSLNCYHPSPDYGYCYPPIRPKSEYGPCLCWLLRAMPLLRSSLRLVTGHASVGVIQSPQNPTRKYGPCLCCRTGSIVTGHAFVVIIVILLSAPITGHASVVVIIVGLWAWPVVR